jgi:hypothetical protein
MGTTRVVVLALGLAIAGVACGLLPQVYAQDLPGVKPVADERSAGMPSPLTDSAVANARQAASAALLRLGPSVSAVITDHHLGFTSLAELNRATAGSPIQIAFVRLDRLAAYANGQSPNSIIDSGGAVMVPVLVDGTARCAVMLKANGSVFTGAGLGQPNMTRLVTQSLEATAKEHNTPSGALVVLKVPALFLTFIARSAEAAIWLTPVSDTPTFDLHAGQELKAEVVFARLQPAAQNYHPSTLSGHTR